MAQILTGLVMAYTIRIVQNCVERKKKCLFLELYTISLTSFLLIHVFFVRLMFKRTLL